MSGGDLAGKQRDWKDGVNCPYCGNKARWCNNKERYGRQLGKSYMCYWCEPCDAYVGCHQNSMRPLGTMANKELREWRMKAHDAIDPIWRSGRMSRRTVYARLSDYLGYEVHVGWSDIEQCKAIIIAADKILKVKIAA